MGNLTRIIQIIGAAAMSCLLTWSAQADSVTDFYRGKQITLGVGASPGDGYDAYARLLARFFSKHMPGSPSVIVVNVPGAGSLTLVNRLIGTAPRDGTFIGTVYREVPIEPALKRIQTNIGIEQIADLNWLGSMDSNVGTVVSWVNAPQKSFADLYHSELVVGGAGPTGSFETTANVLRNLIGLDLRIVSGYPGSQAAALAMERGEIQGLVDWDWATIKINFPHLLADKKLNLLAQVSNSSERHPELKGVPTLSELLEFNKHKNLKNVFDIVLAPKLMGRPYVAPAGVPADRVAALRKAFLDTLKDPEFLAAAEQSRFSIVPVTGEEVGEVVGRVLKSPKEIVAIASRSMSRINGAPGQLKSELAALERQ